MSDTLKTYKSAGPCEACGLERWKRHRHHVIPKSLGGPNTPENIKMLCGNCHEDQHRPGTEFGTDRLQQSPEVNRRRSATARKTWADPVLRQAQRDRNAKRTPEQEASRLAAATAGRRKVSPEAEAERARKSIETNRRIHWLKHRDRNLSIYAAREAGASLAEIARAHDCSRDAATRVLAAADRYPEFLDLPAPVG